MKKILMVAITLIAVINSFGQVQIIEVDKNQSVTVGKLKSGFAFIADLEYKLDDKDTVYTLSFQDNRFTQITSIKSVSFNSDGDALNSVYSIFKSVFKDENKKNKDYNVTFNLGQKTVQVINSRMMGITYVRLLVDNSYSIPLLESQVDKLFGKN
jgi:hypothetical protein